MRDLPQPNVQRQIEGCSARRRPSANAGHQVDQPRIGRFEYYFYLSTHSRTQMDHFWRNVKIRISYELQICRIGRLARFRFKRYRNRLVQCDSIFGLERQLNVSRAGRTISQGGKRRAAAYSESEKDDRGSEPEARNVL